MELGRLPKRPRERPAPAIRNERLNTSGLWTGERSHARTAAPRRTRQPRCRARISPVEEKRWRALECDPCPNWFPRISRLANAIEDLDSGGELRSGGTP